MERNAAIYDYWHQANLQQLLHNVTPKQLRNNWHVISLEECQNGKLNNQNTIEPLLMAGSTIVIVPFYAQRDHEYFFPCLLLADLNPVGRFMAKKHLALPIIPRTILEPSIQAPFILGSAENFDNYVAMQPPNWLDEDQAISWPQQLAYAHEFINDVNPDWRKQVTEAGFNWQENALVFPIVLLQSNQYKMSIDLLDKPGKVNIIDAERNSGKSTYAKQLIINAWIEAAVKQLDPPKYVWLEPDANIHYASIFSSAGYLETKEQLIAPHDMHAKLVAQYNINLQGQQLVRNWREVSKRISDKYSDKGGVACRMQQLQTNLKEIREQKRHLQVLHSIWHRQVELVETWSQVFDFIPLMQRQRLQRLYTFFKQNFPNQTVQGLNQKQLENLLQEKILRTDSSERITADALHQVENDLYQENLVRDKCLQWCADNGLKVLTIHEIQSILHGQMWNDLVSTALNYWQYDFAAKQGHANFLERTPDEIDLLIVEHAEYISPMLAARMLAISKRVVVMGNYDFICNPRFSVQIDYELTKNFGLTECDADFEDLQFDGILGSVGNFWNLATKDKDADQVFTQFQRPALQYEYIDVRTPSSMHLGSKVNVGVKDIVIDWLNKHATLRNEITIYTCFSGQATLLAQALQSTFFSKVPVRLIQEAYFNKSTISLFIPVYSADDQGPYVFDRGTEMLEQIITNTLERLIVIGDMSIFKPELHSAAGKFAKALFANSGMDIINIIQEQEEVICV